MAYAYLAIAFLMNASANVLLKLAASSGFTFRMLLERWTAPVWEAGIAALLFGGNLIFYLLALRSLPLSTAYPIMIAMTFLIVTGASFALGERISLLHLLGLGAIALGIALVTR